MAEGNTKLLLMFLLSQNGQDTPLHSHFLQPQQWEVLMFSLCFLITALSWNKMQFITEMSSACLMKNSSEIFRNPLKSYLNGISELVIL